MSFDARSRERLEALGRTLPQKLPPPAPRTPEPPPSPVAERPRHRLESEQDPVALFHALIEASTDGSVPTHLLERLRSLEEPGRPASPQANAGTPSGAAPRSGGEQRHPSATGQGRRGVRNAGGGTALRGAVGSDRDLYEAFEDLLRGDDDSQMDAPPPNRRPADTRLQARPTLRGPRSS